MPVFNLDVRTSTDCYPLSQVLTKMVNLYNMGSEQNKLVSVFSNVDNPDWQSLPPIWHRPNGVDIVVNLGKFEQVMAATSDRPEFFLGQRMLAYRETDTDCGLRIRKVRGETVPAISPRVPEQVRVEVKTELRFDRIERFPVPSKYKALRADGKVEPGSVPGVQFFTSGSFHYRTHNGAYQMLTNLLIGAVLREAAYSIFNQQQVRDTAWFKSANGYAQNIITVFDELRVERQGLRRFQQGEDKINNARDYVRTATAITANLDQVVADMARSVTSGGDEGASLANIALNSSLILGRTVIDILMRHEVQSFHDGVEGFVGADRLEKMYSIWARYVEIQDATEANIMPLVHEWMELFPSAEDGSNAQSSVAPSPESQDEGEGEGEGSGAGEGEGEDGEGSEDGSGTGDGEGEGEGEGNDSKDGKDGSGKGEGKGEKTGKSSGQQAPPKNLKDAKGAESSKSGTKGAQPKGYNVKNTSGKNSDEDPGVDEIVGGKDLVRSMVEPSKPNELGTQAIQEAEHNNHDYGPRDMTPSRISYKKATHRHPPKGAEKIQQQLDSGRILKPSPADYVMGQQLGKVLESLNVTDRGKFTVADVAPPGRLRSRAAVQQAAERAKNMPRQAKPWERTKRTVDLNPPLTVGIMTDVSGSMGWAEKFVAQFTWIVQHAVSTINGRAAALAFGNGATVTLRPGERMEYAQVVTANGGGEEFDMGIGTLDVMLNLADGQGTRLLFVVTDGQFVFENMMPKSRAWIDHMTNRGVHIIWVTPNTAERDGDEDYRIGKYSATPNKVTPVRATELASLSRYGGEDRKVVQLTRELMTNLGNEIQKAVRAAKMNRRV